VPQAPQVCPSSISRPLRPATKVLEGSPHAGPVLPRRPGSRASKGECSAKNRTMSTAGNMTRVRPPITGEGCVLAGGGADVCPVRRPGAARSRSEGLARLVPRTEQCVDCDLVPGQAAFRPAGRTLSSLGSAFSWRVRIFITIATHATTSTARIASTISPSAPFSAPAGTAGGIGPPNITLTSLVPSSSQLRDQEGVERPDSFGTTFRSPSRSPRCASERRNCAQRSRAARLTPD
jgi:hypothetical protein